MVQSTVQLTTIDRIFSAQRARYLKTLVAAASLNSLVISLTQGQEQINDGMSDPFSAGMPDMPVDMPDMPTVDDMPILGDVPELGYMQDFDDAMPAAPQVQPPSRESNSISQKRKILRAELDKLSQDDQRQLRRALRQVWANEKVVEARTAYREAGRRYQSALYNAMLEQDDQLRPFLERLLQAGLHMPMGQAVEAYVQVARLFEVPEHQLEPNKEAIADAFSRASQSPDVLAIRLQLQHSAQDDNNELNQKLRDALRSALLDALPSIRDWIEATSELYA